MIKAGACHALFAYDIGLAINLEAAAQRITEATEPETIRHKRRVPSAMEFRPTPLRVIQSGDTLSIAGFSTSGRVECVVYDFGAVSVAYSIPLAGPLDSLLALSDALYENAPLLQDSRTRVERLLRSLGAAVDKPHIADFVEDFAVYQIEEIDGSPGALEVISANRPTLARILRAEPGPLSTEEIDDALSCRLSFQPGEQVIIDWNSAILFQREAEDVRAVLEYANVELLELRRLDDQLDTVLDRSYQALNRRLGTPRLGLTPGRELRHIAELQMDSALLFEGVNNALKLIGDQYLARLYRLAAQRMHLPDWDASILRKLQTAESIYQKLADQQSSRRMETLEWIIIILIAFEVVMSFVRQ
jgi:hypothetical protein